MLDKCVVSRFGGVTDSQELADKVRALGNSFKAARVDFDGNICALPVTE